MEDMVNSKNADGTGLDKISADDYGSSEKNVAVDLTKVERPRMRHDDSGIVKCDDYGHSPTVENTPSAPLEIEKISNGDFSPEKKVMAVNNPRVHIADNDAIIKDSSEAAPPDPDDVEFKDMAYVSKKDEGAFVDKNKQVNLSPVTKMCCRRCGKELSQTEVKYFVNRCASCYKKDTAAFQKKALTKYFWVVGLIILIVVLTAVADAVDNRGLNIAFLVIKLVATGMITVYFTLGILARFTGRNMAQIDYIIIGAIALAASCLLVAYVSIVYEIAALGVFVYIVVREQRQIKSQQRNYSDFLAEDAAETVRSTKNDTTAK